MLTSGSSKRDAGEDCGHVAQGRREDDAVGTQCGDQPFADEVGGIVEFHGEMGLQLRQKPAETSSEGEVEKRPLRGVVFE